MDGVLHDLRYGLRMLVRNPGFTAVAALTLTLGIGATTVIFTFVNIVVLRPLPYPDSDRLMLLVGQPGARSAFPAVAVTPADYLEWEASHQIFSEMGGFTGGTVSLTGAGEPARLLVARVTPRFFDTVGVAPIAGRTFTRDEAGAKVAVIGASLWRSRFQSDPTLVGRTVTLDGEPFTVVGVMPDGYAFPQDLMYRRLGIELWTPVALSASDRGNAFLQIVGRLKPGITQAQVDVEVARLGARVAQQDPRVTPSDQRMVSVHERLAAEVRPLLLLFLAAVGFVLLIACTNVANLLLARAASRHREVAIRTALGSGRWRLVRQFLAESVLLGLLGGAGGLLVAVWGMDAVKNVLPPSSVPRFAETNVDAQALAFTMAIALVTSLLFGIGPALYSSAADVTSHLKEALASQMSGSRWLNLLVVAEVALAFVLLTGAGLFIRSFARLTRVDPGFQPSNILTLSVTLPETPYETSTHMRVFAAQVLERLRTVPGVTSAAVINWLPLGGDLIIGSFTVEGVERPRGLVVTKPAVSADYFRAMGIPILRGRAFTAGDTEQSQGVAIVTDQLARQLWPGQDALGKRLKIGFGSPEEQPWLTVVGVAGDVKQTGLGDRTRPAIYMSIDQAPRPFLLRNLTFVVRAGTGPSAVAAAVRQEVRAVDPNLPFDRMLTMEELLADSVSEPRFRSVALGGFAAMALVLVGSGILGVLAYSVSRRTREIGVRMAIGAQRIDVLALVVRQALVMTAAGLVLGLAGAAAMTRLLTRFLFEVRPTDPMTFAGVSLVLIVAALVASYVPARRASSVDPLVALRLD